MVEGCLLVNRMLVNVPTYSVSRVRLGARVCTKRFLYKVVGIHKLFTTEITEAYVCVNLKGLIR